MRLKWFLKPMMSALKSGRGFPVFGHFNRFSIDVGTFAAVTDEHFLPSYHYCYCFFIISIGYDDLYGSSTRTFFHIISNIIIIIIIVFGVVVVVVVIHNTHTLAHSKCKWYSAIWRYNNFILLYSYIPNNTGTRSYVMTMYYVSFCWCVERGPAKKLIRISYLLY